MVFVEKEVKRQPWSAACVHLTVFPGGLWDRLGSQGRVRSWSYDTLITRQVWPELGHLMVAATAWRVWLPHDHHHLHRCGILSQKRDKLGISENVGLGFELVAVMPKHGPDNTG